jgi:predicted Zn-dependent protease
LAGIALLWLRADLAAALSMREMGPSLLLDEDEIELTNQADHFRPEVRSVYRSIGGETEYVEEHMGAYHTARQLLDGVRNMSHSNHILHFVMSHPGAPVLPPGGCLYLPNDRVWASFYRHVEHPYPSLFPEMIANSYYPSCDKTSLSGLRLPSSCGPGAMRGSRGCFNVTSVGSAAGISVYETAGHVGLPDKWSFHIENTKPHRDSMQRRANATGGSLSPCGTSNTLPAVPAANRLEIPTRYVVCRRSVYDNTITEDMVREQNEWANQAFSGRSPWTRMDFDDGHPVSVDMQISFKLVDVNIVTDAKCAKYGFTYMESLNKYNPSPGKYLTVVIITNDASGVLGQTTFPFETPEDSLDQIVVVSAVGFRGYARRHHEDLMYDEGDTVVHESGHALGLYHTFENGCSRWEGGDSVEDTAPERLPHYSCQVDNSCGESDPVHNFMDYSPDTCMVGFSEGQKRRAHCVVEHFRPTLYKMSLKK